MHDNEDTAKYRSNIANEICVGGASSLAEVVFVYIDSLKIFFEKVYREFGGYKKMCNLSLSLSHCYAAKYIKYYLIFNGLQIIFSPKNHWIRSVPPPRSRISRLEYVYGGYAAHGYIMSAYRFFYGYTTGKPTGAELIRK